MTATRKSRSVASTSGLFAAYLVLITFEWLGLQNLIPPLKLIRFTTLLGYGLLLLTIARLGIGHVLRQSQGRIFLIFIAFTMLSLAWAVVTFHAFNTIRPLIDYTVFFVLTALLVDRDKRFVQLGWTMLFIVMALVARNAAVLGDAARASAFAAGPFLGDGNDFAWGMVIALPLIGYLAASRRDAWSRAAGILGVGVCIFAVVGTSSRGSSLGLAGSLLFYCLVVSRHKLRSLVLVLAVVIGVVVLAPPSYMERMNTINHYEQDSSAQSRLILWRAAFAMAVDYPLGVGAGNFASAYGRYYTPVGERSDQGSEVVWAPTRWLNAHSVYFKTLGEYGFIGLALVISLIVINLRSCLRSRSQSILQGTQAAIRPEWPGLLATSLVGYAICGIFLGGLTYPHLFFLSGLVVATRQLTHSAAATASTTTSRTRVARSPGT
jgi:probable O-glycosylation ligase (exosortase A-associated)